MKRNTKLVMSVAAVVAAASMALAGCSAKDKDPVFEGGGEVEVTQSEDGQVQTDEYLYEIVRLKEATPIFDAADGAEIGVAEPGEYLLVEEADDGYVLIEQFDKPEDDMSRVGWVVVDGSNVTVEEVKAG